jgi:hypothetical protein
MVKKQITNIGVIRSIASADDGCSTGAGREKVLSLGLEVGKY